MLIKRQVKGHFLFYEISIFALSNLKFCDNVQMKTKNFLFIILLLSTSLWSQITNQNNKIVNVLTFNILHGATIKGDFNYDIIADIIKETDPDFVALQEVDFKTNRIKGYDLATELGWRVGMAPIFASAMKFDGGEYGNAILSQYSFIQMRKIHLPFTAKNEPRVAVEIITVIPSGDTIAFVCTHLDHHKDENDRLAQVEKINEVFSLNKYPTILAGDLNAIPNSNPIKILEEMWLSDYDKTNPEPTFPSDAPEVKIDYVMCYPKGRWKILETKVIQDSIASDHCAYFVKLELLE